MSRRSTRRSANAGGAGWLPKTLLGLIVLGLLASGAFYAAIRGYLHSDAFRRMLSGRVNAAARVDGGFAPLRWDGLAVESAAFTATGRGLIREMRLDDLRTEIGLSGLRRGVWELRGSRVRRLEISMDARKPGEVAPRAMPPLPEKVFPAETRARSWMPRELEMQGMELREVALHARLDQGMVGATGMSVNLEPAGAKRAYRAEIAGGRIQLPSELLPEIRLDHARLRCQDGAVFLTSATAAAFSDGRIDASGEWDAETRRFALEGRVSGVKCEELFNEDWAKRFIGVLSTDFTAENHSGKPVAKGLLTVNNGTLTALPVLDALAAYADTRRFRVLALSEARTEWRLENDVIELTGLVLASEGLARLEGNVTIRGRGLDGAFRLGVAPGTLAGIPGAETHVFTPGERGMLWTSLRVTGTLEKPKEDLTDRLIAAAGIRMLETLPETGDKVIKFSRSVLGEESTHKAIEKGVRILGDSGKTVREVTGILDGILGTGRRGEPQPEGGER